MGELVRGLVAPHIPVTWVGQLPAQYQAFADCAGLAWGSHIWISDRLTGFALHLTLCHELAHVEVGTHHGHSAEWLDRTIGGVHLLVDAGVTVMPAPSIDTAIQLAYIRQDLERTYV